MLGSAQQPCRSRGDAVVVIAFALAQQHAGTSAGEGWKEESTAVGGEAAVAAGVVGHGTGARWQAARRGGVGVASGGPAAPAGVAAAGAPAAPQPQSERAAPCQPAQGICGEAGRGVGPDLQHSCCALGCMGVQPSAFCWPGERWPGVGTLRLLAPQVPPLPTSTLSFPLCAACVLGPSTFSWWVCAGSQASPAALASLADGHMRRGSLRVWGRRGGRRMDGRRRLGAAVYAGGNERTHSSLARFHYTCQHDPDVLTRGAAGVARLPSPRWRMHSRMRAAARAAHAGRHSQLGAGSGGHGRHAPALPQAMPWWKPGWCRHPACQPTPGQAPATGHEQCCQSANCQFLTGPFPAGLASPPSHFSLSTGMETEKRHSGSYPALPACPYALLRAVVGVTDRLLPHPIVYLLVSMKGWPPLLAPLLGPPPHTHTVKPGMLVPPYLGAS